MKIYMSHAKGSPFENELYAPLKESHLPVEFIFPHDNNQNPYNSKDLFANKKCDLVLAEVSYPATGQGIELGWADIFGVPIICFYKTGSKPASSLRVITDKIIEYSNPSDLINKLTIELELNIA